MNPKSFLRWSIICLGLVVGLGILIPPTHAAVVEVDIGYFYDSLAPYGHWMSDGQYGWVWRPSGVPVGWRPYTDGQWAWNDDYGWTWISDWEWGWAPFHYGRWDFSQEYGWYWIPGNIWAPAWVVWRHGGGYLGWAPLPPRVQWRDGHGLDWDDNDVDRTIGHESWVFVDEHRIFEPRLREAIILQARNGSLIQRANNISQLSQSQNRVVNQRLSLAEVEAVAKVKAPHWKIEEVNSVAEAHYAKTNAHQIPVFKPTIKATNPTIKPPTADEFERRQQVRLRTLEERHQVEKKQLEQTHSLEQPKAGSSMEALQKQKEAERQAMQKQHQTERQLLERKKPSAQVLQKQKPAEQQVQQKQPQTERMQPEKKQPAVNKNKNVDQHQTDRKPLEKKKPLANKIQNNAQGRPPKKN